MKKLASTEHNRQKLCDNVAPFLFIGLIVMVWQCVVDLGIVKRFILPSPSDVLRALYNILPTMGPHLKITLQEALLGYAIAIILAVVLAILMDGIKWLNKAIYPVLVISQTIPIIALAPLFVIWFGFGILPKIIVVVLVCFFPIVVNLLDGLNSVDSDMLDLMKTMGATKLQTFLYLKFPASAIYFFSGLRIAATYSIMGAVIGEWLGGTAGLGVYMLRVKHAYSLDKMFAAILIIVLLSMLVFKVITWLQRGLMPWYKLEEDNSKGKV